MGSVPEMRIWSILLIESDLKWNIHLSRSLFLYVPFHFCDIGRTYLQLCHIPFFFLYYLPETISKLTVKQKYRELFENLSSEKNYKFQIVW